MAELIFEVTGMHCSSCGLLVDDAVEDVAGVTSSSTDVRTGRTTVEIASTGINPSAIHDAITSTGYTARLID
ncbi:MULTISPECIES: heavy-metal-associated domain-containing protein [Kribbella]|uniref:HMA domain-containing protein n=1 Tax=Kribbella sancticallisti TaxID=460087 RepID=A0ABP4QAB2_9ACTN|nr:heavy-metal-associated domain-containing protein [Kribbella catacumbae]